MRRKIRSLLLVTYVLFFASCSRQIAPVVLQTPPQAEIMEKETDVEGKFLPIDTALFASWDSISLEQTNLSQSYLQTKARALYNSGVNQTKWLTSESPSTYFSEYVTIIRNATRHGLNPQDYHLDSIQAEVADIYQQQSLDTFRLIRADREITLSLLGFLDHLQYGKIKGDVSGQRYIWKRSPVTRSMKDVEFLSHVHTPSELASAIELLIPSLPQYEKLQSALEKYQILSASDVYLPEVGSKEKIEKGDRHPVVPAVRRKLSLADFVVYPVPYDSTTQSVDSLLFDSMLEDAVIHFQATHGLQPDGILGERTIKFLRQSFAEKAALIALNMERLRWIPARSANCIVVNIPEFRLHLFENGQENWAMNVIVGSASKPTPVFNDAITHIVFSPNWTVPTSIIREEIIPHLRRDSAYYSNRDYQFYKQEVLMDPATENWESADINPYHYRVVQMPGGDNSLGRVKFGMPNNYSIYLHDTPNHNLFRKCYRALSHGCVRLDEPFKLAQYLLKDRKEWGDKEIRTAMYSGSTSTVFLRKKIPVYMEYATVFVDDNEVVHFREDIYGHDRRHLSRLKADIDPVITQL